ncbi:hypothetical protein BBP00_00006795 [Phytophthora kernoviae]|uniref:Sugar transporter SWEET1 n=1 Tax=Phytophthora kernoviae TaxID=325452 RepID=A0A3F2RK52_9STRA|nr:hypothetical protein BBP00_00006795 [Phytophthora kernoviae]
MSTLLSILEVLSIVTAIMVAFSPAPDFWHIYKNRSTGNVSILPVVMIFCNCYAWVLYAYQVSNFVPLFTICTVGMLTSIMFGSIYYRGSSDHAYVHKVCSVAFIVLAIYTLYYILGTSGVTNQSDDAVEKTLGILSDVVNVVLNASPLETMKKVIQTKDASTIPIILSTIFLVSAAVWVAYAIADDDMFVLLPNALGSPNSHDIQSSMSPDFVSLKENSAV